MICWRTWSDKPRAVSAEVFLPVHAVGDDVFEEVRLGVAVFCGRQADGAAFAQVAADVHFQDAPFAFFKVNPVVDAEIVHRPQGVPDFLHVVGDVLFQAVHGDCLVAQVVMQFQVFRDDAARFVGFRLHVSQDDGFFTPQHGNRDVNAFAVLFHEHFMPFLHQAPGARGYRLPGAADAVFPNTAGSGSKPFFDEVGAGKGRLVRNAFFPGKPDALRHVQAQGAEYQLGQELVFRNGADVGGAPK